MFERSQRTLVLVIGLEVMYNCLAGLESLRHLGAIGKVFIDKIIFTDSLSCQHLEDMLANYVEVIVVATTIRNYAMLNSCSSWVNSTAAKLPIIIAALPNESPRELGPFSLPLPLHNVLLFPSFLGPAGFSSACKFAVTPMDRLMGISTMRNIGNPSIVKSIASLPKKPEMVVPFCTNNLFEAISLCNKEIH